MHLTYLTPDASWASTAKSFSAPNKASKISDYNLGKYFTYEHEIYGSLQQLAADMKERTNSFAIYGKPIEMLEVLGDPHQRLTENFPYPDDTTLHCFDIDGLKVPESMLRLHAPTLQDSKSVASILNILLENEGMGILAKADKVITLSSSSWQIESLHLHFYCEFSAPIRIEAMREFTTALAKVKQFKLFDPAVYKAVQPQFFTAPDCIGFTDPLEGKRIFYYEGETETVDAEAFQEVIRSTLGNADWNPQSTASNLPAIGKDWYDTIKNHINDTAGINEPCYRAAAQLLQQRGRVFVKENIHKLAQEMFDLAWQSININCISRGGAKDKSTYGIARFRQYLQSACEKPFGNDVDNTVAMINEAIDQAVDGNIASLTSPAVVEALNRLKATNYAAFIPIENRLKNARVINATQLKQLLKSRPVDTETELLEAGDGNNQAENILTQRVLELYDYIADRSGNKYACVPGNGDGGYRMIRIDGNLINVFFVDGLDLSGGNVGPQFGKRVLATLLGKEAKTKGLYTQALIGTRTITASQGAQDPVWFNIGQQKDGVYKTIKLEPGNASIMTHQDTPVKWKEGVPNIPVATNEDIRERFGLDHDHHAYLINTLGRFIAADGHDLNKVIMWLVSCIVQKTHAYLAELVGPAASGKSTAADFMKDLIDPSNGILGSGDDRTAFFGMSSDFLTDIEQRHITIIDNLSKLSVKDQDSLCLVSTGMRHSERILYTQSQMERTIRRPLILTCLDNVITRADLRSRVVTIELGEPGYNPDLYEEWDYEKPFLTAALLKLSAETLQVLEQVKKKPKHVGTRDIFISCVITALREGAKADVDYSYISGERLAEAQDSFSDNGAIQLLIAYLQDQHGDREFFEVNTRGLLPKLKKWAFDNSGKTFGEYTVVTGDLPLTGRGLGWEIRKNYAVISSISSWIISRNRAVTNGKVYRFTNKNLTTLEDLL